MQSLQEESVSFPERWGKALSEGWSYSVWDVTDITSRLLPLLTRRQMTMKQRQGLSRKKQGSTFSTV